MYAVILAGGGGTRLWPLSRPDRPKPFLPLLGDETLLQRTVARIEPVVGDGNIFCIVDRRHGHLAQEQIPNVGLIVEPNGKNTAPAITLATVAIDRPDDEVMIVLPADHWIEDEDRFREVIAGAATDLAPGVFGIEDPLVTLGITPTGASTDYGYLRPDTMHGARVGSLRAYPLLTFEEKPAEARARELLNLPGIAWNAGMFAWRRRAIWSALEKYTPLTMMIEQAWPSDLALDGAYDRITPVSIDYAVMEGAADDHRVVMAPLDVGWSDLGSWTALLEAMAPHERGSMAGRVVQSGDSFEVGPDDLVVRPVDGRLAVDTPGEGRITPDSVWAHLAGARHLADRVQAMLDRVHALEVRA